jgi:hypothetical protein
MKQAKNVVIWKKKNEMKIPKGFISSVLGGASCIPVKHIAQHL